MGLLEVYFGEVEVVGEGDFGVVWRVGRGGWGWWWGSLEGEEALFDGRETGEVLVLEVLEFGTEGLHAVGYFLDLHVCFLHVLDVVLLDLQKFLIHSVEPPLQPRILLLPLPLPLPFHPLPLNQTHHRLHHQPPH